MTDKLKKKVKVKGKEELAPKKKKSKDKPVNKAVGKPITSIKQLKGAKYNPRFITDTRLKSLESSISSFGDLSGVVFNNNIDSGVLISGHQRIASIAKWKTRVEVQKTTDAHGTVGVGFIHATNPKSEKTISIPLRIVNWSDRKAEYAANIAANAHGGEFDNSKLAALVEKLDMDKMPSSLIGLDPLQLRGLRQRLGRDAEAIEAAAKAKKAPSGKQNGSTGKFKEYTTDDVEAELQHRCPRCDFRFNS